jgi:SAM-dependent methyltransferase
MEKSPMKNVKKVILKFIPDAMLDWYRRWRYGYTWYDPTGRSVPQVFADIYRKGLWGKSDCGAPFYSGPGSDAHIAEPYINAVRRLITDHNVTSIVDLGCGDFRVSSQLVGNDLSYCGLDVVKELIEHNNARFSSENVTFRLANLLTDELPSGQLCLIRQVLQHLSNDQVASILTKCRSYPFVVITEHLPNERRPWTPNLDITHGNETRVDLNSGLVFDAPPFNLHIHSMLCEVCLENGSLLRTVLLANEQDGMSE